MRRAILEFELPEESDMFMMAYKGHDYAWAIDDFFNF